MKLKGKLKEMIVAAAIAGTLTWGVMGPSVDRLHAKILVKKAEHQYAGQLLKEDLQATFPFPAFCPKSSISSTYIDTVSDTANNTSYTFTNAPVGAADSNRTVILEIGWRGNGSTVSTPTSVTIGGSTAYFVSKTSVPISGIATYWLPYPTGTTATITVTFDNTANACAVSIYRSTIPNLAPFYEEHRAYQGTGHTYDNFPVFTGGLLTAIAKYDSTATPTFSWNGVDSLTSDITLDMESTNHVAVHTAITETSYVRDGSVTSTNATRASGFVSWVPSANITHHAGHRVKTSSATTHTFEKMALGPPSSTRYILAIFNGNTSAQRAPSSCTINGVTAEHIGYGAGTNSIQVAYLANVSSDYYGDVSITFDGAVSNCTCTLYYYSSAVYLRGRRTNGGTGTSFTVTDIGAYSGGDLLVSTYENSGATSVSVTYGGSESVNTRAYSYDETISQGYNSYAIDVTTDSLTNDLTMSSSGSSGKRITAWSVVEDSAYSPSICERCDYRYDSGSATTYNGVVFKAVAMGKPTAARMVVMVIAWSASADRSLSSGSIDGQSFTIVDQVHSSTGGLAIVRAAVTSHTAGDVSVTFSGGCTSCSISTHATYPASQTPVDNGNNTSTGTSLTVDNIEVKNGGFAIWATFCAATESTTVSYNGTDTPVRDFDNQDIGTSRPVTVWQVKTTEDITTNDMGFSHATSVLQRAVAASWL